MRVNFSEIVNEGLKSSSMKPGTLIKGRVLDVQKNWVVVDTHLKTESVLPRDQFEDNTGNSNLNIGDEVELMLESVENGLGRTQVSYGKAKFWRKWLELEEAHKNSLKVKGTIKNRVRGGFSVYIDGIKAFLPGSLIEIGTGINPAALENTETSFKIVKINRSRFNIILSHKSVDNEQEDAAKKEFFESLMKAGTAKGRVKKIMDFGAFIDLGKGEGLVYIADIMWQRIHHPRDVLKVGEEYEFKVINYNREKNRLSLSLREMQDNPWDKLKDQLQEDQEVSGIVSKIDNYGFFVELSPGIVGLVHLSEIDWVNKAPRPGNYVKLGDKVTVKVLSLDIPNRRMSLGYKQCFNNPWEEYANEHSVGEIIEGKVKNIHSFGIFVALTKDLDGFVYSHNIDWDLPPEEAIKLYSKGDTVKAMITTIEVQKKKVGLNIKKTKPNVFMDYIKQYQVKKSEIKGTIKSIESKRIIVQISDEFEGIITASELGIDRMQEPADLVKVGEEITALLWKIDSKKKQIFLSLKAITQKQKEIVLDQQEKKKGGFFSTLGDILNIKDKNPESEVIEEQKGKKEADTSVEAQTKLQESIKTDSIEKVVDTSSENENTETKESATNEKNKETENKEEGKKDTDA